MMSDFREGQEEKEYLTVAGKGMGTGPVTLT